LYSSGKGPVEEDRVGGSEDAVQSIIVEISIIKRIVPLD
jgi:hypothetical protein